MTTPSPPRVLDEYFTNFQTILAKEIKLVSESLDAKVTESTDVITELVSQSKSTLLAGISHLVEVTETDLMDLKYIIKPQDVYTFRDFASCTYTDPSPEEIAWLQGYFQIRFSIYSLPIVRCNVTHCSMRDLIQATIKNSQPPQTTNPLQGHTEKQGKRAMVICCMRHHYEIENMTQVTIDLRMNYKTNTIVSPPHMETLDTATAQDQLQQRINRLADELKHGTGEMFIYVLRNGL